jgi:hypothetical protein
MNSFRLTTITLLSTLILAACPGDGNDDSTGDITTGTAGIVITTGDGSASTSDGSTSTGEPTSGDDTSTGAPAMCGPAAAECSTNNRDWCPDLAALCAESGLSSGGTDYCANLDAQCAAGVSACDLCFYLANTCAQLPSGKGCNSVDAVCLCRAVEHKVSIEE